MAFEGLTERLQGALKKLRGKGKVSEADLKDTMREIRLALLEADVNLKVAKDFVKHVSEKANGAKVLEGLNPAQQIIKIVNEELTEVMGSQASELEKADHNPTVIMMVGLQGAGKTTTAGKLAYKLKQEKKARPLFIAADVYRPAAIEQLEQVAQQIDVPVFQMGTDVDPVELVKQGLAKAKEDNNDYVIIDTAGRLQIDEPLMNELVAIKQLAKPTEILLVVDSLTGQNAATTAEGFNDKLDITGTVLTKLDSDTRGGAALSIRYITGKPIKFVGEGEKMTDLDVFHPDRMASRILGMGDMLSLIEKAEQVSDEKKMAELEQKMREASFDFNDFLDQMDQMNKMGGMQSLIKNIPGLSNNPALANSQMNEDKLKQTRAIIYSMTNEERENPDLLNPSRRKRIAKGSGNQIQDVNRLIKQFMQMRQLMKQMSNGNMDAFNQMIPGGMSGMFGGTPMGNKMGQMAMKSMMRKTKKNKKKRLNTISKKKRRKRR